MFADGGGVGGIELMSNSFSRDNANRRAISSYPPLAVSLCNCTVEERMRD